MTTSYFPGRKEASIDVLVFGCTAVDIVAKTVDVIPDEGSSAIIDRCEFHLGGNAANAAVCLAKLGLSVELCSRVGQDQLARFCVETLGQTGVGVAGVRFSDSFLTACSLVMIPQNGNRRILHAPGATVAVGERDVDDNSLSRAKSLLVSGFYCLPGFDGSSLATLLKRAKEQGLLTCLDTSVNHRIQDWFSYLKPALPFLDIIFPSEEEARTITGKSHPRDMVGFFRQLGIDIAGVKLAEKGSVIGYEDQYFHVPAYPVDVVDTCGAGDAFMAGFLTGLSQGRNPHEAAQFGNAAGALCVQHLGATTGIPSAVEVERFRLSRS